MYFFRFLGFSYVLLMRNLVCITFKTLAIKLEDFKTNVHKNNCA